MYSLTSYKFDIIFEVHYYIIHFDLVKQEFDTFGVHSNTMHNDVSAENGMGHAIERLGGVARMGNASPRRISGASSISGYYSDDKDGAGKYAQVFSKKRPVINLTTRYILY